MSLLVCGSGRRIAVLASGKQTLAKQLETIKGAPAKPAEAKR